jgi:hypothetical protein
MKCEFCGGDLSLEAEVCPHCGRLNKHAQQHIKDMKHYKGQFESTQQGVYSVTRKYTEITTRIIVIALLVVGIVGFLLAAAFSWDIKYNWRKADIKRNAKEYIAVLEEYMEAEEFAKLDAFCQEKYIDTYSCDAYDPYAAVIRTAGHYTDFYLTFMGCVDKEFTGTAEWMCDQLNFFYNSLDPENYTYMSSADNPDAMKALEKMESDVELMLQVYLGLTPEEIASLKDMTEAQRTVLIEEKFTDEK